MKNTDADCLNFSARLFVIESQSFDFALFQNFEARCLPFSRSRPKFRWSKLSDNAAHPAIMIDSRVTHHKIVDFDDFARAQERPNNRLSGIELARWCATGINQQHFRARQLNHRSVAMPDIQMRYAQLLTVPPLVPPIPAVNRKKSNR